MKPNIVKTTKEVNTCAYCGVTTYFQAVCSSCQVNLLIDAEENQSWGFGYVTMWAKRLDRDVTQVVQVTRAYLAHVDPPLGKYSVCAVIIDGSGTEYYAEHRSVMTRAQAERMIATLTAVKSISLNGLHWARI